MSPIVLTVLAMMISFSLAVFTYPKVIPYFRSLKVNQSVSEYALDAFKDKPVTPTLGGTVFVAVSLLVSLVGYVLVHHFWRYTWRVDHFWLVFAAYEGYSLIGLWDDYKIIKEGKNDGLSPWLKAGLQLVLAIIFFYIYQEAGNPLVLNFPIINQALPLGFLYILLILVMFVGSSNAVNITDGMDGLAGGTSMIALVPFMIFAHSQQSYLLLILLGSILGSLAGFLLFNHKPAKIFMGDCGSLGLGGMFAALALVLSKEIILIIVGGVFVWETMTVILQILAVKTIKKRIFKYTPIHYSFIISGWREQAVVLMFYLVGFICALLGLWLGFL